MKLPILGLFVMLLLLAMPFASGVIYKPDKSKAEINDDISKITDISLKNKKTTVGSQIYLQDCDILSCRLYMNLSHVKASTLNSLIGKSYSATKDGCTFVSADIYQTWQEEVSAPIYGDVLISSAYTAANGTVMPAVYERQITGYNYQTKTVEGWKPIESNKAMQTGKTYELSLLFKKKNPKAICDLIPSITFDNKQYDVSEWAWWNTSWGYVVPIQINTTTTEALTLFPARIDINTSNTTLWNTSNFCSNVRFTDAANTSELPYDMDNRNASFCGNESNLATFWVLVNTTDSSVSNTTIFAYLGNLGATDGENATLVWGSTGANFTNVWHMNNGTDEMGVNNLTENGTITYGLYPSTCKIGACANTSTHAYLYKASATHPLGASSSYMSIWSYRNAHTSGSTNRVLMSFGTIWNQLRELGSHGSLGTQFIYFDESTIVVRIYNVMGNNLYTEYYAGNSNGSTGHSVYVNTTTNSSSSAIGSTSAGKIIIGSSTENTLTRNWTIGTDVSTFDEARLSSGNRSVGWSKAEYAQTSLIGSLSAYSNPPVVTEANITPTPNATVYDTLRGNCTITSSTGIQAIFYTWYQNGILYSNGTAINGSSNWSSGVSINVANLSAALFNVGDNITFGCIANNTHANSTQLNSTNTTIVNPTVVVTLLSRTPANINSTNAITTGAYFNYSVDFYNATTPKFFWKLNATGASCLIFVNGTCIGSTATFYNQSMTNLTAASNISQNWTSNLEDNSIYPATYVYSPTIMENTSHTNYATNGANDWITITLRNISNTTQYGFFEFYANRTVSASTLTVRVCNSTCDITGGSCLPASTSYCTLLCIINNSETFNHTHVPALNYSKHHVCSFGVQNGSFSGIKITPNMTFALQGVNSANDVQAWGITANSGYPYSSAYTANGGVAWTSLSATFQWDAHLHAFPNDTAINFFASDNGTTNSTLTTDAYELVLLPLPNVEILYPLGNSTINEGDYINITWVNITTPNYGYNMSYYNLSLYNANSENCTTFNNTITANASLNTSYYFNSTNLTAGYYCIRIDAFDTAGETSATYQLFPLGTVAIASVSFDKTYPIEGETVNVTVTLVVADPYLLSNISLNMTINGITYALTNTSLTNWYSLFTAPFITNTSMNITFNATFSGYADGIVPISFNDSANLTILNLMLNTNCSNGTPFLNFTFFNQYNTSELTPTDIMATFYITPDGSSSVINQTFWIVGATNATVCFASSITNGTYNVNGTIAFNGSAGGYDLLYYFLINEVVTLPVLKNISLYNLDTTDSTAIQFNVKRFGAIPLAGYYVELYRYYAQNNSLLLVSMGKTDSLGKANSYIVPINTYYQFKIIDPAGNEVYSTDIGSVSCDPAATLCSLNIVVGATEDNPYPSFYSSANGTYCTYDNTTLRVSCTSTDPTSSATFMDLYVYKFGTFKNTLVCHNHSDYGNGTVICGLPDNSSDYYYVFNVEVGGFLQAEGAQIINSIRVTAGEFGENGVFSTLGLVATMALLGLVFGSASGAILMTILGLILAMIIGFMELSLQAVAIVALLGIILIYIMRGR